MENGNSSLYIEEKTSSISIDNKSSLKNNKDLIFDSSFEKRISLLLNDSLVIDLINKFQDSDRDKLI